MRRTSTIEPSPQTSSAPIGLWGYYVRKMATDSRLNLGADLRQVLGSPVAVTFGLNHCIRVFRYADWNLKANAALKADVLEEDDERGIFLRRLYGACDIAMIDPFNRLTIAEHLRAWAGLPPAGGTAVLNGVGANLEIRSEAAWSRLIEGFTTPGGARPGGGVQHELDLPSGEG